MTKREKKQEKTEAKATKASATPKPEEMSDDKLQQVVGGLTAGSGPTNPTGGGCASQL